MRLWERLADSISGVAGLMPEKKARVRKERRKMKTYLFWK